MSKPDTFRKEYRELTDIERERLLNMKERAERLLSAIDRLPDRGDESARCKALARTRLEEAVFWATKAAT